MADFTFKTDYFKTIDKDGIFKNFNFWKTKENEVIKEQNEFNQYLDSLVTFDNSFLIPDNSGEAYFGVSKYLTNEFLLDSHLADLFIGVQQPDFLDVNYSSVQGIANSHLNTYCTYSPPAVFSDYYKHQKRKLFKNLLKRYKIDSFTSLKETISILKEKFAQTGYLHFTNEIDNLILAFEDSLSLKLEKYRNKILRKDFN